MAWTIEFDPRTEKELRKIGYQAARRIRDYLRDPVAPLDDPRQLGQSLQGQWAEYWRYRVGDYRVICALQDEALTVLVVRVGHRREIYRQSS